MKNILLIATTLFAISTQVTANEKKQDDFSGNRIGAGFSNSVQNYNGSIYDSGQGLHLEYGYDFNKIVGLNLAYDTSSLEGYPYSLQTETIKVGADVGYTFVFSGWALKPYGSVGYASVQANLNSHSYYYGDRSATEDAAYFGLGIRAHLNNGIYFDIKSNAAQIQNSVYGQASWTVGYKF